jgi:hypothetical protein
MRDEMARMDSHSEDPEWRKCYYHEQQLTSSCLMIVFCFLLFAAYRMLLCVKFIHAHVEAAQSGALGSSQRYAYSVVMHGPLFVCTASSFLVCIQELTPTQECGDEEQLGHIFMFAVGGLLVGVLCCALVVWQATLAPGDRSRHRKRPGCAPAGFVNEIATVPYDPDLFGPEDSQPHYAECPICLGEFGPEDEIKVPSCGHAFHKECLGRWLRRQRTCAICRQDVTLAPTAGAEDTSPDLETAVPAVAEAGESAPETATAAPPVAALDGPTLIGHSSLAGGTTVASQPVHEVQGLQV